MLGVVHQISVCFASDVPCICISKTDVETIDLSTGAFDQLTNGDQAAGVATIDWYGSINEGISGFEVKS